MVKEMSFKLPKLSFSYESLEPYIDRKTMEIHYTKHHQTYVDNTNKILNNTIYSNYSENKLVRELKKINIKDKQILINNLGGHINHSFFWKNLKLGTKLFGTLKSAIKKQFYSFESFVNIFEKVALEHFGSGWVWLIKESSQLKVVSTVNQNNPLMGKSINSFKEASPIICLDIWEHAYYLKYNNRKIDYIKSFWNIINWEEAERQFLLLNL